MLKDFKSFVGNALAVTIITTAAQVHKHNDKHTVSLKLKLENEGFIVSLLDVEFEDVEILRHAEIIVIAGGNPYYLLQQLKVSGAHKVLTEMIDNETPVYGISAGILVLMKSIAIIDILTPEMNNLQLIDKSGLGVIHDIIIPHFDRFFKEGIITHKKVKTIQAENSNRLIRLGESQWIQYKYNKSYIDGDWFEQPLSLQETIAKTTLAIQASNVSQELDTEIEQVKLMLEDGEEDIDDWLKNLNRLKKDPSIIHDEIALHTGNSHTLENAFKQKILNHLDTQLSASANNHPDVLVVRNTESDELLYNLYSLRSPAILLNRDGVEVNGTLIGDYQYLGISIQELEFWDSPIDIDQLFLSISSEYFDKIIWLRGLRIYQSLLKCIEAHIKENYPTLGLTVLIGKFQEHLFST